MQLPLSRPPLGSPLGSPLAHCRPRRRRAPPPPPSQVFAQPRFRHPCWAILDQSPHPLLPMQPVPRTPTAPYVGISSLHPQTTHPPAHLRRPHLRQRAAPPLRPPHRLHPRPHPHPDVFFCSGRTGPCKPRRESFPPCLRLPLRHTCRKHLVLDLRGVLSRQPPQHPLPARHREALRRLNFPTYDRRAHLSHQCAIAHVRLRPCNSLRLQPLRPAPPSSTLGCLRRCSHLLPARSARPPWQQRPRIRPSRNQ
mmetsp:Transcript_22014/g.49657  ORF Transcript_22014/g.49657 Transcript_22014/m.49657 type:complete len:252 (+) Transcript_22014:1346-2101(+)